MGRQADEKPPETGSTLRPSLFPESPMGDEFTRKGGSLSP